MTAEEYLTQTYRLNELIESDKNELADLNELKVCLGGMDYSKERVQTSPPPDAGYTRIVAKIADLEEKIRLEMERMVELKIEIRDTINAVPDKDERLVLRLKYIQGMKWEDIGEEMSMSDRNARRIHERALENLVFPETCPSVS